MSTPAVGGGPPRSLATDAWDPKAPVFDSEAVARLTNELILLAERVQDERTRLEDRGATLGLTVDDESIEVPAHWAQSAGSPVYFLRAAESHIRAAANGTVCRDQHPPAVRVHHPPPGDRWCCTHEPDRHCEP